MEVVPYLHLLSLFFVIILTFIYSSILSINMTVRISLDVTQGTFTQIENLCKEEYRNKADYLRMLIDDDLNKRGER